MKPDTRAEECAEAFLPLKTMSIPKQEKQLAIQEPSIPQMLQAAMQSGVTSENVAVIEKMMGLYERMQDKQAERDYAASFVALQAEMPKIAATKAVPNNDKTIRYKFAPYDEIMRQVQPFLAKRGFTVTFDNKVEEGRISAICTLIHVGGHTRSNTFAVRVGKGPPGSSDSQADGSASSYAKRFALCNALNIVVEQESMDDDARMHGSPMAEVQWKELQRRVGQVKADEAAFLKYAGAANYESIPAERYTMLDEMLFRKEKSAGLRDEDGQWKFRA